MSIEETIADEVRKAVEPLAEEMRLLRLELRKLTDPRNETPLSNEKAAERLGVSLSTLRRMKLEDKIGSILTAKGRLVRVCDIEKWEESHGLKA